VCSAPARTGGGAGAGGGAAVGVQAWQPGPAMVCEALGLPAPAELPGTEARTFVEQAVIAVR
jgi:hypothetical protein